MVTMKAKITESDVRKGVKNWCNLRGWYHYHNLQGLGCKVGLADMTIVKKGYVIWVELKRPGREQSPAQLKFENEIRNAGGYYVCAHSAEELERYIAGVLPKLAEPALF